jgi:hypothetical protein
MATTSELIKYFGLLLGMMTVLFDGVTVSRNYKVRWLLTSSYDFVHYSSPSFFIYSDKECYLIVLLMEQHIHITDAKVDDAYGICKQIKSAFDTKITSISVENAACKVAESVAKKLQADGDKALPLCDPAHFIDLLSKDLTNTSDVCSVLGEAQEVFELCHMNQIDNICKESIKAGEIPNSVVAPNVVKTHMTLTYIHLSSALAQSTFIASFPTNKSYRVRAHAKKQELDTVLVQNCNH